MPRDYASKSHRGSSKEKGRGKSQRQQQRQPRRWGLLLSLLIVVIIIALAAVFFNKYRQRKSFAATGNQVTVAAAKPTIVKKHASKQQVEKQNSEVNIVLRPSDTTSISEKPNYYEIVIATVDQLSQADEIRDRVQRLGYKITLHQVEVDGRRVFRLEMGPYKTEDAASRVQTALQSNNIVTVVRAVY